MAKKPSASTKSKAAESKSSPAAKPKSAPAAKSAPAPTPPATKSAKPDPKGAAKPASAPAKPTGTKPSGAMKPSTGSAASSAAGKTEATSVKSSASPAKEGAKSSKPAGSTKSAQSPAPAIASFPAKGSAAVGATKSSGAAKPPSGPPTKGKTGGKGSKAPPVPEGPKQRYSVMSNDAMAASKAAAAKLAAAAGLHPVQSNANGDNLNRNYTRLTKTPFAKKELAEFKEMLVAKRRQLEGDVNSMESEALGGGGSGSLSHMPQHMADQGTDTFDQSLALDLAASQRTLLKEIDDALDRIENGTYGVCEDLGKPISVERLRHAPWSRYCIEAARMHERAALFR